MTTDTHRKEIAVEFDRRRQDLHASAASPRAPA